MTITKILCATDFSEGSRRALRVAVELAKQAGGELTIAHAWYVPVTALTGEYVLDGSSLQQMSDDAERELAGAIREAESLGAPRVRSKLLNGAPWSAITDELESSYDLAVVGTHGRTGLARVLLGSIAEKIIRHAPCSVLAVRPDHEPRPFEHILCPIDFSESAQHAVDLAAELVRPGGAGITLLHVAEVPVAYSGEPRIPDFLREIDRRSAELLDQWATQLRARVTVPVTTRVRIGWPGAEILAVLDADPSFDLVVTGSHGRTGIKRVLLGSVAEKIVRHARPPVLVARRASPA